MRQGSNFSGTEEELLVAMKENLKKFVSDWAWLSSMMETKSEQEYIDICESLAECVDRGYIKDIGYNVYMNKRIIFHPTKMPCTITFVPEGTSEEELAEHYKNTDKEPKPHELTQAGKDFLNS